MFILKKKIKNLYKSLIINLFFLVYKKPKINKNRTDKTEKIFNVKLDKEKYQIFELKKGRVFTDTNDTTAYITKNNYISESSLQYKKFDFINSKNQNILYNETLKKGTPKLKKKINGNVLSLVSGGASRDNFTHWLTDVIPRINIYKQKFNFKKIDKFYVPSAKHKFQLESLSYFGILKKNIITSEKFKHIEANKLYATSHPCLHKPTMVKKWSLNYLNRIYKNKIYSSKYQKIFIHRDQLKLIDKKNLNKFSGYRILLNENEIKNYLSSIDFAIIKPENYSFSEQIKIFSSAKYVVGLYGAAMMMLTFCKKKTTILEIKPLKGGDEFKNISKLNKLKHKQIILKPIIKSKTPQNGLLFCPIKRIKKELKDLGLKNI